MNAYCLRSKSLVWLLALSVCWLGNMAAAQAAMIGTGSQLAAERDGAAPGAELERTLASAAVQKQLIALGVDPDLVRARVAALSDGEIAALNQRIDELPKGGVLGLIGAVFVVLLILEVTGVIDVFKGA